VPKTKIFFKILWINVDVEEPQHGMLIICGHGNAQITKIQLEYITNRTNSFFCAHNDVHVGRSGPAFY